MKDVVKFMLINDKIFYTATEYIVYLKKQNKYSSEEIIDLLVKHWYLTRMEALHILEYFEKDRELKE